MPDAAWWQQPSESFGVGPTRVGDIGPAGQAGIEFGADTEVYRDAADRIATADHVFINGVLFLSRNGQIEMYATDGSAHLAMQEGAAPGATADMAKLFARDDGAGSTELAARFPTGAVTPIAREGVGLVLNTQAAYASRALVNNTEYVPSAIRPTLVLVSPKIDVPGAAEGYVAAQVGAPGATAEIARTGADNDNLAQHDHQAQMAFIVPAGKAYKVVQITVAGAPVYALGNAQEIGL